MAMRKRFSGKGVATYDLLSFFHTGLDLGNMARRIVVSELLNVLFT